jgi:hypothetical protein
MFSVLLHVADPAGTMTVSVGDAAATIADTSA